MSKTAMEISRMREAAPPVLRPMRHLMRAAWLQALRRNELYAAGILLGLYGVGAVVLRIVGIETPQTARFVAGLGLQLGSVLASLLVIGIGARQMPLELELRTIYPVLAKPVTRAQVLLGKALPAWAMGTGMLALFIAVTLAIAPRLPYQHPGVLAEALALKAAGLAMLTALTIWISLWLPLGVTMLLAGAAAFGGDAAINILIQAAGGGRGGRLAAGLIPDFALLDHFTRYVNGGGALGAMQMSEMALYGALWTAILGGLAVARFRRMML